MTPGETPTPVADAAGAPTLPHSSGGESGPGQLVGRYQIVQVLGRGGMGVVYLARDPALDRLVAVKMLVEGELAAPEAVARFQREAQAVARVRHPNIAQVYEVGSAAGRPFLVMEYLEGGTLAARLDGRPLPPREAAAIVETLARAMQAAHEKDVVHRDLKPSNVLAAADGTLKIADFGLAKRLDATDGATATGDILGSPGYMAPEQAGGVVKNIGPACDVYALGAVLYELLTGRPPFHAPDAMQTVLMVLSTEAVSVRRIQPQVPRDLSTICHKCLEKQSKRRYASAAALADDLRQFQQGLPIAARPVGAPERAWRWARRRPAAAALAIVSLSATATLLVGGAWYNAQLRDANDKLNVELQRSQRLVAEGDRLAQWVLGAHVDDVGRLRGGTVPQKNLVERLKTYLAGLAAAADDQALRRTIARSWYRLSEVQGGADSFNVGDAAGALASCEEARRMYERALETEPDDAELKLALLSCRRTEIHLRTLLGLPHDEQRALRGILNDLELLRLSGRIDPPRMQALESIARADLGWSLRTAGRTVDAAKELRRALEVAQKLDLSGPDGMKHGGTVALVRSHLAQTLRDLGDFTAAREQTERLIAYCAEQVATSPTDARRLRAQAQALVVHGDVLVRLEQLEDGKGAYRRAEQVLRAMAADDPDNVLLRLDLVGLLGRIAGLHTQRQEFAEAKKILDEAATVQKELLTRDPRNVEVRRRGWLVHDALGAALYALKQWDAALLELRSAQTSEEELLAEDASRAVDRHGLAQTLYHTAVTLFGRGAATQSDDDVRRAVVAYRRSLDTFAELERAGSLGPDQRALRDAARKSLTMTEEMLKQFDAPQPKADDKPPSNATP